jgi:high affinity Mn2+ porin
MSARGRHLFIVLVACAAPAVARGQSLPTPIPPSPAASATTTSPPQRLSFHVQSTNTQQYHGAFPAAYSGRQSLYSAPDTAKTFDFTFFLGARIWRNGEIYINPELDQGFGLGSPGSPGAPYNGTFGVAGFFSGEAYKVGAAKPYERVQRLFIRQTFDVGGPLQSVDAGANQLGGSVAATHVTLTAGKFSVPDVFDNNAYAHDPRNDFLNWSIIDMGAFDYAADSWGYTYGMSAELIKPASAIRVGLFQLSKVPNQIAIEHQPFRQYSPIVECDRDTSFFGGRPGAYKALVYGDDGYFGTYADAVALAQATGTIPDTALVRTARHWKLGGGVNFAQEVAPNVGVFARASAMNGTYEVDEFTEIDRSLSGGISVDGALFNRPADAFGLALAFNALSGPAQQYFTDGGLGVLIGDGGLSYAGERILETYYKLGVTRIGAITLDYQHVSNPGYNAVRGPVSVVGLRYHVQL